MPYYDQPFTLDYRACTPGQRCSPYREPPEGQNENQDTNKKSNPLRLVAITPMNNTSWRRRSCCWCGTSSSTSILRPSPDPMHCYDILQHPCGKINRVHRLIPTARQLQLAAALCTLYSIDRFTPPSLLRSDTATSTTRGQLEPPSTWRELDISNGMRAVRQTCSLPPTSGGSS